MAGEPTARIWKALRTGATLLLAMMAFSPQPAEAFGLACWYRGTDYHYRLSRSSARGAGFAAAAAHLVAWHDTALDLYHEHRSWQVRQFMNAQWDRLHFDDLFDTDAVLDQWRRYVHGALYGLLWAAENRDSMAGITVLGVALHALQDFFSHSNWMDDPERRGRNPFEYREEELRGFDLWTGAWNKAPPDGRRVHGGKGSSPGAPLVGTKLGTACACRLDEGINLDRPCSAMIAVGNRKIPDGVKWKTLFDQARARARDAGRSLLTRLGRWLRQAGHSAFWKALQGYAVTDTPSGRGRWRSSYLDPKHPRVFAVIPWGFLSGGAYAAEPGWHLRVQVETSDGTDGDVLISTGGRTHKLDRGGYDDFERGDDDSYYVGPFLERFDRVRLRLVNRGRKPSWRIRRLRVWAYRVGGPPAFGLLIDAGNVRFDDSARSWSVRLPAPFRFRTSAFR